MNKLKRLFDLFLCIVAVVICIIPICILCLLVYLTSAGPILYWSDRVGKDNVIFKMAKFRSMKVGIPAIATHLLECPESVLTPVGSFLRKSSLDELPQLWNVFIGDMSLVGPRPERPVFTRQFSKTLPTYMARHAVKAGMTGWAQVNGWRGNTSLRKRLQYDLYYIVHWTPWLDLKILWMTVFHGFTHKNAY